MRFSFQFLCHQSFRVRVVRLRQPALPGLVDSTAKDSDGGFRKDVNRVSVRDHGRTARKVVGIGVTVGAIVFPFVLFAAEGDDAHGPGEKSMAAS